MRDPSDGTAALNEAEAAQVLGEVARARRVAGRTSPTQQEAAQLLGALRQVRRLPETPVPTGAGTSETRTSEPRTPEPRAATRRGRKVEVRPDLRGQI